MKTACIILPTYNEKDNISILIDRLLEVFKTVEDYQMHIHVVDDKSPDGTGKIVENYMKKHKNIHLTYGDKKGLGMAYINGFKQTMHKYDVIFCMDADLQHPPEMVPDFLKNISEGNDLVIGSRYIPGGATPDWNIKRKVISRGGNFFARVIGGMFKVHDCTSGFRAIRTELLRKVEFSSLATRGYAFLSTLLYELYMRDAKIKEIPLVFYDRQFGETKLKTRDIIEFFLNSCRLRLKTGNRFAKFVTIGALGVIINTYLLWLFVEHIHGGMLTSAIIATELAIIFNFFGNEWYTFSDAKDHIPLHRRFLRFNAISLYGFVIHVALFYLLISYTNMFYIFANFLGICAATVWNYIMVKGYTWRIEN